MQPVPGDRVTDQPRAQKASIPHTEKQRRSSASFLQASGEHSSQAKGMHLSPSTGRCAAGLSLRLRSRPLPACSHLEGEVCSQHLTQAVRGAGEVLQAHKFELKE